MSFESSRRYSSILDFNLYFSGQAARLKVEAVIAKVKVRVFIRNFFFLDLSSKSEAKLAEVLLTEIPWTKLLPMWKEVFIIKRARAVSS